MAFHHAWLFLECKRPPTPREIDAPEIAYTQPSPESRGIFASGYRNRAAGQFLLDNGAADYGRTLADDLALLADARAAGFTTTIRTERRQ